MCLLAIPLVAMFKIVCDHIDALKPIGFLIGEMKKEGEESSLTVRMRKWFRR